MLVICNAEGDVREIFDVKHDRHLEYWLSQPVDVFLVIRQTDERMARARRVLPARAGKKLT